MLELHGKNFREGFECKVRNYHDLGPSEFVGLFKNASFILTSSFHGTAFSLNFNKPFYSVMRKNELRNCRILSLIECLGLQSRVLYVGDEFPEEDDLFFDYSETKPCLEERS